MPSLSPTLTLVRCTNTTVTVAIEPLVAMDTHLKSYQLWIRRTTNQTVTSQSYITAEFNSSLLVQKTEFVIGNGQRVGGYINKALVPNSYYSIVFAAQYDSENETTTSNVSQLQVFTETFDPNSAKLTTLTLTNRNTTCMNVTWSVPAHLHNTTTRLQLSYTQADGKDILTLQNVSLLQPYHDICGLAPSTTYNFTLLVMTRNGVLVSVIRSFSTVPLTPPSPASPLLVNSSFTNITIIIGPVKLDDTRSTTEYVIVVDEVVDPAVAKPAGGDTRAVYGNVTARLLKRQIPSSVYFVVGNGIVYGGYRNAPLRPYGYYVIYYGACSTFGNYTKCGYSTTRKAVRAIPHLFTVSSPEEEGNDVVGVVLGCVMAALLVFTVIALLVYFRRRMGALAVFAYLRHGKGRDVSVGYKRESGDVKPDQVTLEEEEEEEGYNLEECWSSIHDYRQCRSIIAGNRSSASVIFEEHEITSSNSGTKCLSFADEFQHLRLKPAAASEKIARQFPNLNRSPQLLPYDHSLVKLKPDVSADRTYVNASFIPGYRKTPAYIAAQSPFNETTLLDFWRLIFQRDIKTVVMMTNTQEMGVTKCLQYWPTGQTSQVGHFHLRITQITEQSLYTVVRVELAAGQDISSRIVSIFQMTSWPERGVPEDPLPILEMRRHVKRWHGEDVRPVLVHCSTGVGRTGVFIAIDALTEQYEAEGSVLVFDYVRAIRKDRPCVVRTFSQYVFIYEALFQHFLARDIKTEGLGRGQELSSTLESSAEVCHGDLREQFASMQRFNRRIVGCAHRLMGIKYSYTFNVDGGGSPVLTSQAADLSESLSDLNPNSDKVISVSEPATSPLDCTHCDSILPFKTICGDFRRSKFLILDTSTSKTTDDIIKIVIENDVTTVVSLSDHSLYQYEGPVRLKQGSTLQLTSRTSRAGLTFSDLNICLDENGYVTSKCVRAFRYISLPNERTSSSADLIVGLLAEVFDWQKCDAVRESNVLVHGRNSILGPELLVMLSIICQRMSEHQEVDVYSIVKFYNRRQQLVQDHDELKFCFQVLKSFIACHNDSTI